MVEGVAVELPCPDSDRWNRCRCEICALCGWRKHMSVHGGVIDKPGMVFGHEFVPKQREPQGDAGK